MYNQKIGSKKAVVIVHEIYGINQYIRDWADFFNRQGYDAYCVDLLHRKKCFLYSEQEEAYGYFTTYIGFDVYREVEELIQELNHHYKKLIVFGSSVGAAVAWRLTDNVLCDGMIGYYGSRIRDYLEVEPKCPCLLVFAKDEKSFDVNKILPKISGKRGVRAEVLPGKHGFGDVHGQFFRTDSYKKALDMVECFINEISQSFK